MKQQETMQKQKNTRKKLSKVVLLTSLTLLIFIVGCKPKASLTEESTLEPRAFRSVMNAHAKNQPTFKTISGRLRANFEGGSINQGLNLDYRIERGKTIWMSAKALGGLIRVANAMITPDRVQFYDRINKQYFDGDFQLISELVGIDLDFEKLENLLYGQMLFDFKSKQVNAGSVSGDNYLFTALVTSFLQQDVFIKSSDHSIASQQFTNINAKQNLVIAYPDYQEIEGKPFPKEIQLLARQENQEIKVNLVYRNIQLNENLSFPFSIPNGYSKIEL